MKIKKIALFSLIFSFMFASIGSAEEKLKTTKMEMVKIGEAIESYIIDNGKAPEVGEIKELASLLDTRCIEDFPTRDSWGRNFHYTSANITQKNGDVLPQYWLASSGENSNFEGFLKYILKTGREEGEVIYSNGEFV